MKRSLIGAALLCSITSLCGAAPPPPFTAHYTISKGSIPIGELTRTLSAEGKDNYVYESITEPGGLLSLLVREKIVERSVWDYKDGAIRAREYRYEKSGGKTPKKVQLIFDWDQRLVKNALDGETRAMPVPKGLTDILLYQLVLMMDLKDGKKPLEYPIADKHKFKTYRFDITGEEMLDTPLGKLKTVKVQRVPGPDKKTTLIWCAPSLDYLPVRIEQDEKDDGTFSMAIKSVEGLR
jgi:hypothetical protein